MQPQPISPAPRPPAIPATPAELAKAQVYQMSPSINPMTPTPEAIAANHDVRLLIIEKDVAEIKAEIRHMLWAVIATFSAATGSLLLLMLRAK